MDNEILRHLMDIKERTARTEEKLDSHIEQSAKRDLKLDALEKDVLKAKASLNAIRWLAGLFLITIPTVAAALFRSFK